MVASFNLNSFLLTLISLAALSFPLSFVVTGLDVGHDMRGKNRSTTRVASLNGIVHWCIGDDISCGGSAERNERENGRELHGDGRQYTRVMGLEPGQKVTTNERWSGHRNLRENEKVVRRIENVRRLQT
jgi:hypothetical protein